MVNVIYLETRTLGNKVRLVRVANGWTQVNIASLAKVRQEAVSRLERDLKVDEVEKSKILRLLNLE